MHLDILQQLENYPRKIYICHVDVAQGLIKVLPIRTYCYHEGYGFQISIAWLS